MTKYVASGIEDWREDTGLKCVHYRGIVALRERESNAGSLDLGARADKPTPAATAEDGRREDMVYDGNVERKGYQDVKVPRPLEAPKEALRVIPHELKQFERNADTYLLAGVLEPMNPTSRRQRHS